MKITKIGTNLYKISGRVNSGKDRDTGRVRRKVYGTRDTAEKVVADLKRRALEKLFGWPSAVSATIQDVCELVIQDYKDNSRKSLQDAIEMGRMWVELCGSDAADKVHEDNFKVWAREWMADGLSPARCNRRIAFLRRGFHLATRTNPPLVKSIPAWSNLKESAPRSGFLEWPQFERLRGAIAGHVRIPITIGYWLGMRMGEILGLRWDQVWFDDNEEVVHLRLPDSKSDKPRLIAWKGELYNKLKEWHALTMKRYPDCEYVCHYHGLQLLSIRTAWLTACVKVGLGRWTKPDEVSVGNRGYKGLIPHDLRRTAIRNFDRAHIPRKAAMSITGHETEKTYERYRIVSETEMLEVADAVIANHEKRALGQESATSKSLVRKKPR